MKNDTKVTFDDYYTDETHQRYPLCPLKHTAEKGFYTEILDAILLQLRDMRRYSRILATLFTLTFPKQFHGDYHDTIKQFIRDFPILLRRTHIHFHYIWVLESSQDNGLHVHIFLIISGHDLTTSYNLRLLTSYVWHGKLGLPVKSGFVHCSRNSPFITCKRDENYAEQYAKVFQWGSYLAKISSKKSDAYGRPIWGHSTIKNKKK